MKNDRFYKTGIRCLHSMFCCGVFLLCVLVSLAGCRTSRSSVEETNRETHTAIQKVSTADSLNFASAAGEERGDSTRVQAREHTDIELTRDSDGRIIRILTTNWLDFKSNWKSSTKGGYYFNGHSASQSSETSGSEDSVTKKKEEVTKEINTGMPLDHLIGMTIVALLIVGYAGDYIYKLWKRKQGQQ